MNNNSSPLTILLADDDPDDRLLVREAFEENHLLNPLHTVEDGEELMDYLHKRGKFAATAVRPNLILLDLNMPRKSGMEALREIKSDASLRTIPVIVLTTSKAEEDILKTYGLGVNSFIVKPVTFDSLVDLVKELGKYWFQIVELPNP
ncbi:MAG TPA: response regulator [Pyrinomonadaceae bacterium]|jgi:CheY-like chemotaxis protein